MSAFAGFHVGLLSWSNWNWKDGSKTKEPGKPLEQGRSQQQTQPTYSMAPGQNRTPVTLVGAECSNHYVISAPKRIDQSINHTAGEF